MNAVQLFNRLKLSAMLVGMHVVLVFLLLFFSYHVWRTFAAGVSWPTLLFLLLFLGAQLFWTLHGLSYFTTMIRVLKAEQRTKNIPAPNEFELPAMEEYPPAVIALCSYHEPLDVVEESLVCFRNLTYPNKHLFLLDDTRYDKGDPVEMRKYREAVERLCAEVGVNLFRREWHGAKAGMINDILDFLRGRPRPDFEFSNFQKTPVPPDCKYIAIFDADMNPLPDFVEPILKQLEDDDNLAFIQTPQYYSNVFTNRMALGSAMQQVIFYEYICDGKSLNRLMPCCGTNVIFRIDALDSVGGMDDSSITEDFATSMNMHTIGWRSLYMNHVCAFGMGPQDLAAYFKQQFRWALGSVGLLRVVARKFRAGPGSLPLVGWIDYLSSVTYYCVGWIWLILWLTPILYLLFRFPSVNAGIDVIMVMFFPYFITTTVLFYYPLIMRKYRVRDIFMALSLSTLSFPIYMKASLLGLLGVKGSFGITPKAGATSVPLSSLWPQLTVLGISAVAVSWGALEVLHGNMPLGSFLGNSFWCLFNCLYVGMIFYFNHPERGLRLPEEPAHA